uniref:Uncharacterized protein n=1 Tax=Arundo donax TaxID=35708 RepID=A0A0A9BT29_ARUDO
MPPVSYQQRHQGTSETMSMNAERFLCEAWLLATRCTVPLMRQHHHPQSMK